MAKTMEDRVKAYPLLPEWSSIKGSHKALSNGALFKPDIGAVIKSYDDGLKAYDKLVEEKKKLRDLIGDVIKASTTCGEDRQKHNAERDKIDAKDAELRNKYADEIEKYAKDTDPPPADVVAAINGFIGAMEDGIGMHKALTDRLATLNATRASALKKSRDAYKAKADAITSGMKKLDTDAIKLEAQIRQIGSSYEKTAVQMDHDEIVDDIRGFLDKF